MLVIVNSYSCLYQISHSFSFYWMFSYKQYEASPFPFLFYLAVYLLCQHQSQSSLWTLPSVYSSGLCPLSKNCSRGIVCEHAPLLLPHCFCLRCSFSLFGIFFSFCPTPVLMSQRILLPLKEPFSLVHTDKPLL